VLADQLAPDEDSDVLSKLKADNDGQRCIEIVRKAEAPRKQLGAQSYRRHNSRFARHITAKRDQGLGVEISKSESLS
jgi:hypothetical protein